SVFMIPPVVQSAAPSRVAPACAPHPNDILPFRRFLEPPDDKESQPRPGSWHRLVRQRARRSACRWLLPPDCKNACPRMESIASTTTHAAGKRWHEYPRVNTNPASGLPFVAATLASKTA